MSSERNSGFTGNEGEVIDLETAQRWTKNYRDNAPGGPNKVRAHFFGAQHYNDILNQPGVVGIRNYHGLDEEGKLVLIMVGVDENQNDLERGVIVEKSVQCPPVCGTGSLNGI